MAYYSAAKLNHPDIRRDDPNAKEKFQEVADAYELLSDPVRRSIYDSTGQRRGAAGTASGSSGGHGGFEEHVNAEEVFRSVQEDMDVVKQAFSDYVEEVKDEFTYATVAASKGDWREVWEVVKTHKGLVFGLVVPSLVFLRFPALIAVVMRAGILGGQLVLAALLRTGNVTAASRLLWTRIVALARESASRKRKYR